VPQFANPDFATPSLPLARAEWHPTLVKGILDRVARNAHRIEMKGGSMRNESREGAPQSFARITVEVDQNGKKDQADVRSAD
jgi:hypothetical protein